MALAGDDVPEVVGARTVANPSGTIPDGLNAALAASTGTIVLRCDSRCDLPPGYVRRCVEALGDDTIGMVGGTPLVMDRDLVGATYGIAFNSPLLGPSRHRYSRTSGPADAAYLGAWRREVLVEAGGWDPRLIRNQDNELADRISASGRTVWYDADLVVGYVAGRPLRGILAHHHGFGRWRVIQGSLGQRAFTNRHVASLGVLGAGGVGAVALAAKAPRRAVAATAALGYAGLAVLGWATARPVRRARPDLGLRPGPAPHALAPALAVGINASWLAGIVREAVRTRSNRTR